MGRNNQQRRAAKARVRAKQARQRQGAGGGGFSPFSEAGGAEPDSGSWPGTGWWPGAEAGVRGPSGSRAFGGSTGPATTGRSTAEQVHDWLSQALDDHAYGRPDRAAASCREIVRRADSPGGRRVVVETLESALVGAVETAWRGGWRPAEVHRVLGRRCEAAALSVAVDVMVEQLGRYARSTVTPDWLAQLDELDAGPWWGRDLTFLAARARHGGGLEEVVPAAVVALHELLRLPPLTVLDPLPGQWRPARDTGRAAVDARLLEKVRALLAKAESTTFEAEADTFNAAAQSLMARHSIDAAMLAAARPGGAGDGPGARRVGIDRPYEAPKVLLLDAVAEANRCRTVWAKELGLVTVIGFEPDLRAVETLYTSLLVQAVRAASAAGTRRHQSGRSRTRSFRSSFLTAFADRVRERLQEATDAATRNASAQARAAHGHDVALVLVERSARVDEHVEELFPRLVSRPIAVSQDAEGWWAGRSAADAAALFGDGSIETG